MENMTQSYYKMNLEELKRQHGTRLINFALRHWKEKGYFSDEEIGEKIEKMHDLIISMGKKQFVAMLEVYDSCVYFNI